MKKLHEGTKLDTALKPLASGADLTGQYFSLEEFRKALFHLIANGQTTGQSFTFAVYEAKTAAGGTPLQLGADVTLSQGVKVNRAQVKCTSVEVGDTLELTMHLLQHGELVAQTLLTFTAAAAEDLTAREFDQAGTDDQCATSLGACVNSALYGVAGLTASVVTDTVTLAPTEPGGAVFDITELAAAAARLVVTDIEQQAWFEVEASDLTALYSYVGARTGSVDANTFVACSILRALARYEPPGQAVAASDESA